eukprot:UN11580
MCDHLRADDCNLNLLQSCVWPHEGVKLWLHEPRP